MSNYTDPYINTGAVVPIGLDAAIESIRSGLSGISWVSKSFGRAWAVKEKDPATERIITVPKCYTKDGDYQNVLPNDTIFTPGVAGSSFISVIGEESYESFQPRTGSVKKADLAVIVWANLKMIDSTKDYIFNEQLKKDLEAVLKVNSKVSSINSWVEERADRVFEGYDFTGDQFLTEYLMYPYWGCRIELTVIYNESC